MDDEQFSTLREKLDTLDDTLRELTRVLSASGFAVESIKENVRAAGNATLAVLILLVLILWRVW